MGGVTVTWAELAAQIAEYDRKAAEYRLAQRQARSRRDQARVLARRA